MIIVNKEVIKVKAGSLSIIAPDIPKGLGK